MNTHPRTPSRRRAGIRPLLALVAVLLFVPALVASVSADEASKQDEKYRKAFDAAIDGALAFVAKQQQPTGSFPSSQNPGASALCVMAFLARGYTPGLAPYGEVINRGIDYVILSADGNGYMGGSMYHHNMCALMLSEISGMVDPERQKRVDTALGKALRVTLAAQKVRKDAASQGGWRYSPGSTDSDLSLSGWAIMLLRSARNNGAPVPKEAIDDAVKYIMRCRMPDGGFAYQPNGGSGLGRTGVGLLCLELCGHHREEITIKAGDYVMATFPTGFDKDTTYYYMLYYVAQGMFQLGETHWEKFAPLLYDVLLKRQQTDGSWPAAGSHEAGAGTCYSTAMAVLALSVSYRQLPIYQR